MRADRRDTSHQTRRSVAPHTTLHASEARDNRGPFFFLDTRMKLYTKPGACSTADHIALQWTGQPFEVQVMTAAEMKEPAYLAINPTGAVPAIVDGDFVLTQNAAIMG